MTPGGSVGRSDHPSSRSSEPAHPLPTFPPEASAPTGDAYAGTAETPYDPDAFYTRANDEHGHYAQARANIHSDQMALMHRMLQSGSLAHTPLNTIGAIIRDAVTHRLHHLVEMMSDPTFIALAADHQRAAAITELIRVTEARRNAINEAEAAYALMSDEENTNGMYMLAEQLERGAEEMPEPYAGRMRGLLHRTRSWLSVHAHE